MPRMLRPLGLRSTPSGPDTPSHLTDHHPVRFGTSTALILVDYNVASKLNAFIGAYPTNIRGVWGVNCDKLRKSNVIFNVTLQGYKFNLTGADLPTRVWSDDSSTCYAPFQSKNKQDNVDQWLLGDVFLRKFYQINDYNAKGGWKPRIGFALANH